MIPGRGSEAGGNCGRMLRMNQDLKTETLALLEQFGQVILSGPPGTGKTRLALHAAAASILGDPDAESLPIGEDFPFAFVQFHPSYNYEDFVRGIRVKTDDNNNVVYETVNRVFGDMAKRAAQKPQEKHVLVIDEINRANVSAVLGELIYGLEYRGKEVQTPYNVDGKTGLLIPENLRIIGTMNTADRTIGQIDYAVRRRFAFVHCLPDDSVVKNIGGARALEFFEMVDNVFVHLSADYDKEDVCIGHSYFLADSESKLARKIIYQVVPILREYLKDGVLKKAAKDDIDALMDEAASGSESGPESGSDQEQGQWHWIHKTGDQSTPLPLGPMILSLISHHAKKLRNVEELRAAFPDKIHSGYGVVQNLNGDKIYNYKKPTKRYFMGENHRIIFPDESVAVVTNQWGDGGKYTKFLRNFEICAEEHGYIICAPYRLVNVGEGPHRDWDDCRKFGFLGAGGLNKEGKPQYAEELKSLRMGDRVFASISRTGSPYKGFVGYGRITKEAAPIRDFRVTSGQFVGKKLLECDLKAQKADENKEDDEKCEWVVGVNWIKTFDRDKAVKGKGNPHIVWHSTDIAMLRDLKIGFGINNTDE